MTHMLIECGAYMFMLQHEFISRAIYCCIEANVMNMTYTSTNYAKIDSHKMAHEHIKEYIQCHCIQTC